MSKEKSIKEKSTKKAPAKNLKEKRAAKEAKRNDKKNSGDFLNFNSGNSIILFRVVVCNNSFL